MRLEGHRPPRPRSSPRPFKSATVSGCRLSGSGSILAAVTWAYACCAFLGCLAVSCIYTCCPWRSRAVVGPALGHAVRMPPLRSPVTCMPVGSSLSWYGLAWQDFSEAGRGSRLLSASIAPEGERYYGEMVART